MFPQPSKLLWLWLLPLIASAGFVNWLGDYDTAHHKALKEHKPLLVLVVKKHSPESNFIIRTVFMDRKYVEAINEKTVPVMVTYEGRASYPVEMYYTTVFPTLFFVDAQRELFLKKPLYGKEITPGAVMETVGRVDTHH